MPWAAFEPLNTLSAEPQGLFLIGGPHIHMVSIVALLHLLLRWEPEGAQAVR